MSVSYKAVAWLATAVFFAAPAAAQETGSGDLFGDLYHILRSPTTGQPILQQKTILLPGDIPGIGYCPVPVDATGAEIPLLADSCEVDPTQADRLIEVDYFGRLSGGRTREVNQRMHFDEVIETIMGADVVTVDPAGRLMFGTDCTSPTVCASWKVIDSPLENMAFYVRVMKYGHIQTDPLEEDTSFHGDPALGTVYHPALRAEDWAKFTGVTTALLPRASANQCFSGSTFDTACAAPQSLTAEDFVRSASFLGGAADKTGKMTVDLIQYLNRFLKITVTTALSAATVDTLPALIRDENGVITEATPGLPAPADELFMDYAAASYYRNDRFNTTMPGLVFAGAGTWLENPALPILPFLDYVFGTASPATGLAAFLTNAADAQRAIEFIHNYEIPTDLYAVYAAVTYVTVPSQTVPTSPDDQDVTLSANVTNTSPINAGTVTFTVKAADGVTIIGAPVVSGTVTNGAASAIYVLPGGTPPQDLKVLAEYSGAFGFQPGSGMGTLRVGAGPDLTAVNASVVEGATGPGVLTFELKLAAPSALTVTVQYATADGTAVAPADYQSTSGTATFDPGVTSVLVNVPIVTDAEVEAHETFSLLLSAATNAELLTSTVTGTILDDDSDGAGTDFNSDGKMDLLWQNISDGYLALWTMDGTTLIDSELLSPSRMTDTNWRIVGTGDFNGDYKPDILWQDQAQGYIGVWLMDGKTLVTSTTLTPAAFERVADTNWKIAGVMDLNGDRKDDILWQEETQGWLVAWLLDGLAVTASVSLTPERVTDTNWKVVANGDFNGDGQTDLVWQNLSDGSLAAWLMNGLSVVSTVPLSPGYVTSTTWRIVAAGDINRDGQPDLVWQSLDEGWLAVWLMNGTTMLSSVALSPDQVPDVNWRIVGPR
jgi:hypothetical protein